MRVPKYKRVSKDLELSRLREAEAHRQFMSWSARAENNLFWVRGWCEAFGFSSLYDAEVAA